MFPGRSGRSRRRDKQGRNRRPGSDEFADAGDERPAELAGILGVADVIRPPCVNKDSVRQCGVVVKKEREPCPLPSMKLLGA
jgi:hypothetical protein